MAEQTTWAGGVVREGTSAAAEEIKKRTGGGPEYAFECVGSGALAELAYKAIRRGGKAVIVGVARPTGRVIWPAASPPGARRSSRRRAGPRR